jgi:hypothetical protein
MGWKSIVSSLHRTWTKTELPEKTLLLHIRSCGYAWVFPQTLAKTPVFPVLTPGLAVGCIRPGLRGQRSLLSVRHAVQASVPCLAADWPIFFSVDHPEHADRLPGDRLGLPACPGLRLCFK